MMIPADVQMAPPLVEHSEIPNAASVRCNPFIASAYGIYGFEFKGSS